MRANSTAIRQYECGVKGTEWSRKISAKSPGKAKVGYWRSVSDAWPDVPFTAITCRVFSGPLFDPKAALETEAALWNQQNPVGTLVRYWTGLREGEGQTGTVLHPATVMCGHVSAWIDGCCGCVAITHVEAIA